MAEHSIDTKLVKASLLAAFIAVLGVIPKFDLPFTSGIPITAQSMGVMLAGILLGGRTGGLAVLIFLTAVAFGMPLLAGGRGGFGAFFGPASGFLIGWLPGAYVTGLSLAWAERKNPLSKFTNAFAASTLGCILTVYFFGILWLSVFADITLTKAAMISLVFLPGDLIKASIVAWIYKKVELKY